MQLLLRIVDGQLLRCQGRADRVGFQGLSRLLNPPKLSPYLVTNARAGHQFVIAFESDLNSIYSLVRVH